MVLPGLLGTGLVSFAILPYQIPPPFWYDGIMTKKPRVVIIGGGFAGVYTYRNLHKEFHGQADRPEITLISKNNYFLFTPLLHEVATGSVRAHDIVQPLRQIADTCLDRVVVSPATSIDIASRVASTSSADIPYDYLVLATGAATQLFKFPPELVYTLKTLEDALLLKNHLLEVFDAAERTGNKKERAKLLTFMVVGGGATGVELITEMDEFIYDTLCKAYPSISPEEVKIYLVHGKNELVDSFSPSIRRKTLAAFKNKHMVKVLLNSLVSKITKGKAALASGEVVETETIVMATGITATYPAFSEKIQTNPRGQILVNRYLQIPGHSEIFALGDAAAVNEENYSTPQTAQAAVQEAKVAAYNITALIRNFQLAKFEYREQGQLISLGRWKAAAKIGWFSFSGMFAWWLWRTIYAGKVIGWANRLRLILDWTIDMFYKRDISRLSK